MAIKPCCKSDCPSCDYTLKKERKKLVKEASEEIMETHKEVLKRLKD